MEDDMDKLYEKLTAAAADGAPVAVLRRGLTTKQLRVDAFMARGMPGVCPDLL
jgi:hypothetical protein